MNSGYKIEWSEQATLDFEEIIQFLSEVWNEEIIRKFVRSLDIELTRISTYPYAFPASSLKIGVRRCVLSKYNTIYYQIKDKTIYIITITDNRSNPERLEKALST